MLVISSELANTVRGYSPYNPHAAIDPVPLKSGMFMIPEQVLSDWNHRDLWAVLKDIPSVEVTPDQLYDDTDEVQWAARMALWVPYDGITRPLPSKTRGFWRSLLGHFNV